MNNVILSIFGAVLSFGTIVFFAAAQRSKEVKMIWISVAFVILVISIMTFIKNYNFKKTTLDKFDDINYENKISELEEKINSYGDRNALEKIIKY